MKENKEIDNQIIEAANKHLGATSAEEAISNFTEDVLAVSNEQVFSSLFELEKDINDYYSTLKHVEYAEWENIHVKVIEKNVGLFSAKFKYSFVDTEDKITKLKGVWSAVFIKINNNWKIRFRHETFSIV
jgi:hypothetical protein